MSLIEVISVAGLSLLLMGLLAVLLIPSLLLFQREQSLSDASQAALLVQQRLERELTNTCLETLTVVKDGNNWYLAWAEVADYSSTSQGPVYRPSGEFSILAYRAREQDVRVAYATHTAVPQARFAASSSAAPHLAPSELLDVINQRNGGQLGAMHYLAKKISLFEFYDKHNTNQFYNFYPPLGFHIVARVDKDQAEVKSSVTPRVRRW